MTKSSIEFVEVDFALAARLKQTVFSNSIKRSVPQEIELRGELKRDRKKLPLIIIRAEIPLVVVLISGSDLSHSLRLLTSRQVTV